MPPAAKRRWSFSLRTLFVVVTVLGLVIGFWVRARSLADIARFHEQQLRVARDQYYSRDSIEPLRMGEAGWKQLAAKYLAFHDWHLAMALKYRRASLRPWLQVEPDSTPPPGPEPFLPPATR
jgi:hypothetical protein